MYISITKELSRIKMAESNNEIIMSNIKLMRNMNGAMQLLKKSS